MSKIVEELRDNKSNIPMYATVIAWIEDELHRSLEQVKEVYVNLEVIEKPPVSQWKNYEPGDKMLWRVTFQDDAMEMLHLFKDGTRCNERPGWYLDNHGITKVGM